MSCATVRNKYAHQTHLLCTLEQTQFAAPLVATEDCGLAPAGQCPPSGRVRAGPSEPRRHWSKWPQWRQMCVRLPAARTKRTDGRTAAPAASEEPFASGRRSSATCAHQFEQPFRMLCAPERAIGLSHRYEKERFRETPHEREWPKRVGALLWLTCASERASKRTRR